ncbi:hypothetical protein QBC45DRAFT_430275 [Copromyces sp. CBS 386.78]|nr:hypothetical protein QBC45DRAFT_430275 [Copromyces sp. CBS 386.78]
MFECQRILIVLGFTMIHLHKFLPVPSYITSQSHDQHHLKEEKVDKVGSQPRLRSRSPALYAARRLVDDSPDVDPADHHRPLLPPTGRPHTRRPDGMQETQDLWLRTTAASGQLHGDGALWWALSPLEPLGLHERDLGRGQAWRIWGACLGWSREFLSVIGGKWEELGRASKEPKGTVMRWKRDVQHWLLVGCYHVTLGLPSRVPFGLCGVVKVGDGRCGGLVVVIMGVSVHSLDKDNNGSTTLTAFNSKLQKMVKTPEGQERTDTMFGCIPNLGRHKFI